MSSAADLQQLAAAFDAAVAALLHTFREVVNRDRLTEIATDELEQAFDRALGAR